MSRTKVLLESTIQIHRITNDVDVKGKINGELHDKDVFCTSFVLREFLRTVIADIAFVHTLARKLGTDEDGRMALSRLSILLARGESRFSPSAARREHLVIAAILDRFAYTRVALQELLCYLEYVAERWLWWFIRIPLPNGEVFTIKGEFFLTSLDQSDGEVWEWIRRNPPIPPPMPFPSAASAFLQARCELIASVHALMAASSAPLRDDRLIAMLERMRAGGALYNFLSRLSGKTRGNWCLGDLLIALECPADTAIYTDDRHFEILCSALNKQLYAGVRPREARSKKGPGKEEKREPVAGSPGLHLE